MNKKMKFENTCVSGFYSSIKGMRNPMNSWHMSDSIYYLNYRCYDNMRYENFHIGKKDMNLARQLIIAGSEHAKFLRQIQVWVDVTMPRYWWSEADTYKFGTKNSCSTMHKLFDKNKKLTLDDFIFDKREEELIKLLINEINNLARIHFENSGDGTELVRAKRLLPEGYLQERTLNTNYAELRNMYQQRKSHRLKEEWQDTFCKWIETLPYSKQLIIE